MTELELDAIAMAVIDDEGQRKWIVHARGEGKTYKLTLSVGRDQRRLIDAATATAMELPCG